MLLIYLLYKYSTSQDEPRKTFTAYETDFTTTSDCLSYIHLLLASGEEKHLNRGSNRGL